MLFKRLYGDYMRFIMDEKSFMGFKANEEIKRNCYDDRSEKKSTIILWKLEENKN